MIVGLQGVKAAAFSSAVNAIPMGTEAALGAIDELRALSLSPANYSEHVAARATPDTTPPVINAISVDYNSDETREYIAAKLDWQLGLPLDTGRLEATLSEIYSDRQFSTIQYELVGQADGIELRALPVDKRWGPTLFDVAFQLTDDFDGHSSYLLAVHTDTRDINDAGAHWINRGRIGLRTGLRSEFHQPLSPTSNAFVVASAEYLARNINFARHARRSRVSEPWLVPRLAYQLPIERGRRGRRGYRLPA
jgi:outer membrane translocation and assembly module TamA